MSDNEQRSTEPHTRLPSELWIKIFRLAAAEPPSTFLTSFRPPLSSELRSWTTALAKGDRHWTGDPTTVDFDARCLQYSKRLASRRAFILVCRRWCAMGLDVLYECVVLHSPAKALSFGRALKSQSAVIKAAQDADPLRRAISHPAALTKYLVFYCFTPDDRSSSRPKPRGFDFSVYRKFFRLLKNVQILKASSDKLAVGAADIIEDIIKMSPIRHLSWIAPDGSDIPPPSTLLQCTTTLEFLSMNFYGCTFSSNSLPDMTFPRVHTLQIMSMRDHLPMEWISRCKLPVLSNLVIDGSLCADRRSGDPVFNNLRGFASNITSVDLRCSTYICGRLPDVAGFIALCTSLQDLIIRQKYFLTLGEMAKPHPSLVRLTIDMDLDPLPKSILEEGNDGERQSYLENVYYPDLDDAMSLLTAWVDVALLRRLCGPSFRCLRILDVDTKDYADARWLEEHYERWWDLVEALRSHQIRFELCDGRAVAVPEDENCFGNHKDWLEWRENGNGEVRGSCLSFELTNLRRASFL